MKREAPLLFSLVLVSLAAMACGLPSRSLPPTPTQGVATGTVPPVVVEETGDEPVVVESGLDPLAPAEFGFVSLDAGFAPEVHTVSLLAGGLEDARLASSACSGSVAVKPDYELTWGGGGDLRIFFVGESDASLVILGPGGIWYCNDDFEGIHPYVLFNSADGGVYDIWIGTNSGGGRVAGTLYITEGFYSPSMLP